VAPNAQRGDNVPLLPDQPTDDDQLGRAYFARALAIRIRRVWKDEVGKGRGNFLLHVHGPWGSGKSSVLKLLAKELKKTEPPKRPEESEESKESKLSRSPWMIVEFNAWQHQRIAPPWWWLMRAVYTEGLRRHPLKLRIWEYAWRLRISFSPYLGLLIAALLFLLIALASGLLQGLMRTPLAVLGQGVKSMTDILALLLGLSGIILGLSRLLVLGSARSASSFLETARDPMAAIRLHYMGLIRRTGPVAIFIDDLDRCRSEYVVALLEGIQTLFREAPAVYVVVAERRWLQSCYETAYSIFDDRVGDPGHSLGSLFLEKTFQLSTSVPRMSDTIQKAYWQRLLLAGKGNAQKDLQEARQRAEGSLAGLTKNQISARLEAVKLGTADEQALREVAVVRSAEDDVTEETERMLGAFGPLLEPNPRAMKRLVNAFGVQRDIAIFAGVKTADNELALWTIANLRWPLLTEQLERNPDLVLHILDGTDPADGQLSGIRPLFQDPDVVRSHLSGYASLPGFAPRIPRRAVSAEGCWRARLDGQRREPLSE